MLTLVFALQDDQPVQAVADRIHSLRHLVEFEAQDQRHASPLEFATLLWEPLREIAVREGVRVKHHPLVSREGLENMVDQALEQARASWPTPQHAYQPTPQNRQSDSALQGAEFAMGLWMGGSSFSAEIVSGSGAASVSGAASGLRFGATEVELIETVTVDSSEEVPMEEGPMVEPTLVEAPSRVEEGPMEEEPGEEPTQ